MNLRHFLFIALLTGFSISACKDDDKPSENNELSTAQKLQHLWNVESIVDINYEGTSSNVESRDTIISGAGNSMDFRADGFCYTQLDGDFDTIRYEIINDLTLNFGGEPFTISDLTETKCEFVFKERNDVPYYDNVVRLSR